MKNVKQPRLLLMAICIYAYSNQLVAQFNNNHRYYLEIGYAGGTQFPSSASVGVYGAAGVFFKVFNKPASIDFRAKELYVTNPDQEATLITLTYRITIVKGLFLGVGGAHGHQIMMNDFINEPTSALAGSNEHIMHGTGFNTELGYNFRPFFKRIYPNILVSYTQVMGHHHNFPNLTISAGLKIGLKKMS
jgi:hypothetical protein